MSLPPTHVVVAAIKAWNGLEALHNAELVTATTTA
jgi:hypothetical protein